MVILQGRVRLPLEWYYSILGHSTMSTMKAIGVSTYGSVENFESRVVPRPATPTGRDVLVQYEIRSCSMCPMLTKTHRVKACSVNPIDCKIRGRIYDDAPGMRARCRGVQALAADSIQITTNMLPKTSTSLASMAPALFWRLVRTANSTSQATTSPTLVPRLAKEATQSINSLASSAALTSRSRSISCRRRALG
jgi:hypothetical protein